MNLSIVKACLNHHIRAIEFTLDLNESSGFNELNKLMECLIQYQERVTELLVDMEEEGN